MQSTKVSMTFGSEKDGKKPVESVTMLDIYDDDGAQDKSNSYGDKNIMVEIPFNSLMTELFKRRNTNDLI